MRVFSGQVRRNARVSRPAAIKTTCLICCSLVTRCKKSSKKRVRIVMEAPLSPELCSTHSSPSKPAKLAAQGSLKRRSSRWLSLARTPAVQREVEPSKLSCVVLSVIQNFPLLLPEIAFELISSDKQSSLFLRSTISKVASPPHFGIVLA